MMEVNSKSGSCTNLCSSEEKLTTSSGSSCYNWSSCKKLDGVAAWLCQSVGAAFFASLEWCSCMNVDTRDGPDDHSISSPLLIPNSNPPELDDDISTTTEVKSPV